MDEGPNQAVALGGPAGGGFALRARRSRSGRRVRRYVKVNGLRHLWSLTFQANRNDVGVADRAFWEFSRWLGAQGVLWLVVRECQTRGAVHYHLAVDRFLSHTALEATWGRAPEALGRGAPLTRPKRRLAWSNGGVHSDKANPLGQVMETEGLGGTSWKRENRAASKRAQAGGMLVASAGAKAKGAWKTGEKVKRVTTGRTPGVFADRIRLMRSEQYILLIFGQIFDFDQEAGALLEHCAAQVYLPLEAAQELSKRLIAALEDRGQGDADIG